MVVAGATGVIAEDDDEIFDESLVLGCQFMHLLSEQRLPTVSENMTGKSKRGKSIYRKSFSDFSVSD